MRLASDALFNSEAALFCSKLLPEFEEDRSLRDIYVLNTSCEEWTRLVSSLATSGLHVDITEPFAVSEGFDAALAFRHVQTTDPVTLTVQLSQNVSAHSHFFIPEEVEFDLDPGKIETEADVARVLDFMRALGEILSKDVILTQEDSEDEIIATYKPATGEFLTQ